MSSPHMGRELGNARAEDLRRHTERQRLVGAARARRAAEEPRPARPVRAAGWVVRVVGAALRG